VINASVDTLRPAAEAKKIRIYVVLDYGTGMVLGDPVRLQQVVWNLLSNAIKFTPKKGSVNVTLERINSHFEVTVSDTGPGIEKDFLPYVFDRFRQGDSSTTKKFGGLGLGLAIVRQLTELHGGTVEVSNRAEGGSIFTVKLPIMAARQASHLETGEPEPVHPISADSSLAIEHAPGLAGIKVLAVDDDADSRNLLTAILEQCGAEVRACESAAQALESLPAFHPDVLVSDIGMPGEDGYSLIRKVRSSENSFRRVPAVALTAFARAEDRMKALSAGFNMHVPKPVEPAELTTVIASLVNRD
jgi:CheY-like chemotaxis protein/anti-sigma regulatory factor (Ser/Thr protein kinase)